MLFLLSVYGMQSNETARDRMRDVIEDCIKLIGSAQSDLDGWFYPPTPATRARSPSPRSRPSAPR